MKCDRCGKEFSEREIHESHDVPCYLFKGQFRNERKNQADKFGRHWLCKECHERYEDELRIFLVPKTKQFSEEYFK